MRRRWLRLLLSREQFGEKLAASRGRWLGGDWQAALGGSLPSLDSALKRPPLSDQPAAGGGGSRVGERQAAVSSLCLVFRISSGGVGGTWGEVGAVLRVGAGGEGHRFEAGGSILCESESAGALGPVLVFPCKALRDWPDPLIQQS